MAPYTKPHLTKEQQLTLLQSWGMIITNTEKALSCLERIGYSRLSGYWHPFLQSQHNTIIQGKTSTIILEDFRLGTAFSHVVELYVFDKRLRLLLLDVLERIEVALRVDIAHLLGARDPLAHLAPDELHGNFAKKLNPDSRKTYHQEWVARLDVAINRSREDFLTHFRAEYDSPLPIWMAIELWDFGQLSTFYSGMKVVDREAIARKYGVTSFDMFTNWIHTMNYVRNVCAHHSRLWNRTLAIKPKLPKADEIPLLEHLVGNTHAQSRLYSVVAIMQYLLEVVNPSSSWGKRLTAHMQGFPDVLGLSVQQAGFPDGWEELELWGSYK